MHTLGIFWLKASLRCIIAITTRRLCVKVYGKENLVARPNQLFICKHLTTIDSFIIGSWCIWPTALTAPMLFPWHIAEEKWFYRLPVIRQMFRAWRCALIHRGTGDFANRLDDLATLLHTGVVMIFPEGSRDRFPQAGQLALKRKQDGTPLLDQQCRPKVRWRDGAALLASKTKPVVIPIGHWGLHEVLPTGKLVPRLARQRIVIWIGQPIDLSLPEYATATPDDISRLLMAALRDAQEHACRIHQASAPP